MSMQKCNECLAYISNKSYVCPHCGGHDPHGKGARFLKWFFVAIGSAAIFFVGLLYSL